ncbi:hypothetical protein EST38_g8167 [Candolleomyces aberdarensis]|uniref:Uncharacterized protein n=1 Tax=Candolleomyces aberdarensis TaxID=2316362 RepID=A0A4Q2DDV7_9AGAR|nr:hypothetical protein EST38_g8167 [Candolleomyces aberdarensis]
MFSGSHNQSFQDTIFHTAGRDITFMPTINLHLTRPTLALDAREVSLPRAPLLVETHDTLPYQCHSHQLALAEKSATLKALRPLSQLFKRKKCERIGTGQPCDKLSSSANPPSSNPENADEISQSGSSSSSFFYCNDGISVSSAEDIDISPSQTLGATRAEVYIRSMLTSGKGLASWQPRPRKPHSGERGVLPGDVGTFSSSGGFKKIFNFQEDEAVIRSSKIFGEGYRPPRMDVVTIEEELSVGDTIVKGTSAITEYASNGGIASCEFRMLEPQGAVLALTSSADLEELANRIELRDFIINNAVSTYKYANTIRKLDHDESLYIVTGCIKSDSWALAAYNDLVDPRDDVLRLVRTGAPGLNPTFGWTSRGRAEARSGSSSTRTRGTASVKDQCLFLQGFKIAFSAGFRSRNSDDLTSYGDSADPDGASDRGPTNERNGRQGGNNHPRESGGAGLSNTGSQKYSKDAPSDESVALRFHDYKAEGELHPCDRINRQLLQHTTADIALSHDDDWRFALEGSSPTEVASFDILGEREIVTRNGVAFVSHPVASSSFNSQSVDSAMIETRVGRAQKIDEGAKFMTIERPRKE